MFKKLINHLRSFRDDTAGVISIDLCICLPMILAVMAGASSVHHAYRYQTLNTKAAYTISDAISRQTDAIDDTYVDGMEDLLKFLTFNRGDVSLRVTQVRYNKRNNKYVREWSKTRGGFDALRNSDVRSMEEKLPIMAHNERVILVETAMEYKPLYGNIPLWAVPGLDEDMVLYNYGFTRPRFAPKVAWAGS